MTDSSRGDRLDSIDQRLALLLAVAQQQEGNIELLIRGMGVLMEGMTEMRTTSQQQAQNIDRLTRIVELMLGQQNQ